MALKDTWIEQDNTMSADAEVVNKIADAVIKIENTDYVIDKNYIHTDNNFTNELKNKVENSATVDKIPTKVSQLTNDSSFMSGTPEYAWFLEVLYAKTGGNENNVVIDENYVHTDNNFSDMYASFIGDLIGVSGNDAFKIATNDYVKNYVDTQLGVIENGSY